MRSAAEVRQSLPRHFYSLDIARGIAALIVVFYHWPHLFFEGTKEGSRALAEYPFYQLFRPFYTDGWRAVDLFFCLSGFIFYWLYSEKIQRRITPVYDFWVLRFSRLYPLHFATLLIVAVGQWYYISRYGESFVYPNNDLPHFLLQLGFASNWAPQAGYSYNGPIWSVSIEVFLYAIFFCTAFLKLTKPLHLCGFAFAGYCLMRTGLHHTLGRGMMSFFVGGIAFYSFMWLQQRRVSVLYVRGMLAGCGLLWVLVPLNEQSDYIPAQLGALVSHLPDIVGKLVIVGLLPLSYPFELILYPLTIVTLASWESQRGSLGRRARFLGQISYSSYLLHFPLQLLFVIVAFEFAIPQTTFLSPLSVLLFFLVLIGASLASFHWLELPSQKILRKWLLPTATKERAQSS